MNDGADDLWRAVVRELRMREGVDAARQLGDAALLVEGEQLDRDRRDELGIRMARVHVSQGVEPTADALREAMDPAHWAMFADAMHRRTGYRQSDP